MNYDLHNWKIYEFIIELKYLLKKLKIYIWRRRKRRKKIYKLLLN